MQYLEVLENEQEGSTPTTLARPASYVRLFLTAGCPGFFHTCCMSVRAVRITDRLRPSATSMIAAHEDDGDWWRHKVNMGWFVASTKYYITRDRIAVQSAELELHMRPGAFPSTI